MELACGQRIVFFNWMGFDEGDEICGSGSAELSDDGTIEIELSFHTRELKGMAIACPEPEHGKRPDLLGGSTVWALTSRSCARTCNRDRKEQEGRKRSGSSGFVHRCF